MNIQLYNNLSENNIINKTITPVGDVISAVIKNDISVETPTLIFGYPGTLPECNYFSIPEFGRYYYITDIIDKTGGRYELHGKTDVLESFKQDLLAMFVIIDKQENLTGANLFIDDGSFVTENKEFNSVINFPSGFNDAGEYILITAGGGGGII